MREICGKGREVGQSEGTSVYNIYIYIYIYKYNIYILIYIYVYLYFYLLAHVKVPLLS
jgi:hypothetical protein